MYSDIVIPLFPKDNKLSFAFPHFISSTISPTIRDQLKVCPLSSQVTSKPVSVSLQNDSGHIID